MATCSSSAATTVVTAEDKKRFVELPLQDFLKNCSDGFEANKFDPVKLGIAIANRIMDEFINTRVAAAVQDQRPMADPQDLFTMMQVMDKTNAALLTMINRAEHHEKQTRTIGSMFGSEVETFKRRSPTSRTG